MDSLMNHKQCRLPASGFTHTLSEVHQWAGSVAGDIRNELSGPLQARMWAYRHGDSRYLVCDFYDGRDNVYPLTLLATGQHDFHVGPSGTDASVPDMTEAIHMLGILARALDASVQIGLHENETNESVLSQPLQQGQTNGPMARVAASDVIST